MPLRRAEKLRGSDELKRRFERGWSSGGEYNFASKTRSSPVRLEADVRHDSVRVKLPAGYKIDELPAPAKIESI